MKKFAKLMTLLMVLVMLLVACKTTEEDPAVVDPTTDEVYFDPSAFQVKALDETTLEVQLIAQTPYFLELTAFPTYMPVQQATVEANGDAWATVAETYITSGAYIITDWVESSYIRMEKNPNYWNADAIGPDAIIFNLIEDNTAQLTAFQGGDLMFIDDVPQAELATLKSDPEFGSGAQIGNYYISFNNNVAPFDDPLVRQAFSLAIDRAHIATVIGAGLYEPAGAFVSIGLTDGDPTQQFRDVGGDYYDPSAEAYADNLATAQDLLAQAGYPDGEGLPTIEYIYNEGSIHPEVAEALQDMWAELGATVTVEVQEWATFLNTRKNGDYMVARNGWLNDYNDPIGMLDLFLSTSGNNDGKYNNPAFDALITQIKSSSDRAERFALMHQAEDILMGDWAMAPIMYYGDPYMVDSELTGWWASPLGFKYFMYVEGMTEVPVCTGPNPDTIDPALNSAVDGGTMINHAFEGLYRLDQNGTPVPGLAESVDISEDGLTYTFHLREGLMWSDGSPLTANDFVYSWTRAINPETAADYGYMFETIAGYAEALTDPNASDDTAA